MNKDDIDYRNVSTGTEHWRNTYKDYNIDVCNLYDIVMLWMWIIF